MDWHDFGAGAVAVDVVVVDEDVKVYYYWLQRYYYRKTLVVDNINNYNAFEDDIVAAKEGIDTFDIDDDVVDVDDVDYYCY